MRIDDFITIMQRVARFKTKLAMEGIIGDQRDIILKIYIQDLTSKINTSMLKAV